ncbi:class I SAM-dependent methyltransferase [Candidatus Bathyarchaeota archaeon]|jgi:cyclopropane fatty-acyl-phospholipid synthase-like methyltransferase|nr:class I SAM-dependent methyltransferase [Candidatus Bathyarchaeota archaeon]
MRLCETLSVAPYVSSPEDVVRKMLDMVQLRKGDVLFDLGCGDGRIVLMAVRDYFAKAFGVELREDLVATARGQLKRSNLEGRAQIIHGDFFDVDLSKANVVTLYLTTSANEKLKPKLERELKPNSRVVSHDFSIKDWKPVEVSEKPHGHTIYLYKIGSH